MIPKFRFFDTEENKMHVVDSLYTFKSFGGKDITIATEDIDLSEWRSYSDGVLMQSTGLKDAHGTEIYEKDIVRDSYGDVFLIEWLDGGFVLTDFFSGGYDHCEIDDLESYEVIGNQFQHPHLLEE